MGETWAGGGAGGDGDEAGIRGLGVALGAESLGDSGAPDARRFTAACPAAIPGKNCRNLPGRELVSVALKVEQDKPHFASTTRASRVIACLCVMIL